MSGPSSRTASVRGVAALCVAGVIAAMPLGARAQEGDYTELPKNGKAAGKKLEGRAAQRAIRLVAFVRSWLGTPYLWGGTTRSGIDCSGFLREMFREIYNLELPRTTRDQINLGRDIPLDPRGLGKNFEPGDLFFYVDRTGTPSHVVTYIGDGRFAHSAGGRGVVIDRENALWGRRIVGRRVLAPATGAGTVRSAIEPIAPIRPIEIPCPPDVRADEIAVREYWHRPLTAAELPARFKQMVDRAGFDSPVCANRALKGRLQKELKRFEATSPEGRNLVASMAAIDTLLVTLESLDEGLEQFKAE